MRPDRMVARFGAACWAARLAAESAAVRDLFAPVLLVVGDVLAFIDENKTIDPKLRAEAQAIAAAVKARAQGALPPAASNAILAAMDLHDDPRICDLLRALEAMERASENNASLDWVIGAYVGEYMSRALSFRPDLVRRAEGLARRMTDLANQSDQVPSTALRLVHSSERRIGAS